MGLELKWRTKLAAPTNSWLAYQDQIWRRPPLHYGLNACFYIIVGRIAQSGEYHNYDQLHSELDTDSEERSPAGFFSPLRTMNPPHGTQPGSIRSKVRAVIDPDGR